MLNKPKNLPAPTSDALAHSQKLVEIICQEIKNAGGAISFARFMELALYAPGLGYYSAGARKLGAAGDFVTAPEISPLFSYCLARQCQQVLESLEGGDILELGAGTGRMAVDILQALRQQNGLPDNYFILEVSADLKERQQGLLQAELPAEIWQRVSWLSSLPENSFKGVILANEVMDAMPVQRFRWDEAEVQEFYVGWNGEGFVWQLQSKSPLTPLLQRGEFQVVDFLSPFPVPPFAKGGLGGISSYDSEINPLLPSWLNTLSVSLKQGLILLIDYGFPQHEYYHADRSMGTLMCHYRHHAHPDPLVLVGLQDITAHIDFTAVAEAALAADLHVAGFTTQAAFLLSCGLLDFAATNNEEESIKKRLQLTQQIQKLTSPAEMGELFKVMALTRRLAVHPLLGFTLQDQRGRL